MIIRLHNKRSCLYTYIYKRLRVYDSQMFTHVLQAYRTSEQSFDDSSRDKTLSLCNETKITKISNRVQTHLIFSLFFFEKRKEETSIYRCIDSIRLSRDITRFFHDRVIQKKEGKGVKSEGGIRIIIQP